MENLGEVATVAGVAGAIVQGLNVLGIFMLRARREKRSDSKSLNEQMTAFQSTVLRRLDECEKDRECQRQENSELKAEFAEKMLRQERKHSKLVTRLQDFIQEHHGIRWPDEDDDPTPKPRAKRKKEDKGTDDALPELPRDRDA